MVQEAQSVFTVIGDRNAAGIPHHFTREKAAAESGSYLRRIPAPRSLRQITGRMTGSMSKEIRGKRIILREQKPEDAAYFAYWFSRPQIMFQCGFTEPTDEEKERSVISVSHRSEDSVWFTITDHDGNIIGETGLLRMWPAWHCTDLTIIIPDPKMQHRGFGAEAIRIMLDMAFTQYDMNRVAIGVVGLNTGALEFYKKIGFRQEGIQEQGYYYNNEYSDFIMMRILRSEWK